MANEKTAEEVKRAEWDRFGGTVPLHADDTLELARDAFETGFSAGLRAQKIVMKQRILYALTGEES